MSKKSKNDPKIGEYYKYTDFAFTHSSLEFFKEIGKDEYTTYTIVKSEKDILFLVDIKFIEQKNGSLFSKKHSFIFLVGEKKLITSPIFLPTFEMYFSKYDMKNSLKDLQK